MREGGFPTEEEDHQELLDLVNVAALDHNIQGPRRAVVRLVDQAAWGIGRAKIYHDAYLRQRVETKNTDDLN